MKSRGVEALLSFNLKFPFNTNLSNDNGFYIFVQGRVDYQYFTTANLGPEHLQDLVE